MIGANVAFVLLLGQLPAPAPADTSELVAKLGSGRYAERQSAATELEGLGRQALPALRNARDLKDPEVRSRASALIARIEGALLIEPTMIRLPFEDRPLGEVIHEFGEQAKVKMALYPEPQPAIRDRRITLRESRPLPFWKALDRLCDVAQLQYNLGGMHGQFNSRESVFPLFLGGSRPPGPMSDSGPFRVNLVSVHYQRDVSFVGPMQQTMINLRERGRAVEPLADGVSPGHTITEQFFAQVQVAAEPRLTLSQNGPIKLLEVTDDRGQSLLPEPDNGPVTQRFSGYFGLSAGSTLHLQALLNRPEQPGKTIKIFRGVLPVMVATRKPGPLVIPLLNAAGKSFRNDEVTLSVQMIKINPNTRQTSIEISLRSGTDPEAAQPAPVVPGADALVQRPDTHQQQIEVLDAVGRPIPWYHSNDAEGSRMTMTLTPHDQGSPSEIRYYALARAATEVRFEFKDVPLP